MSRMRRATNLLPAVLLALGLLQSASPAGAGCGCDHPPAAFAPVLPPFASPGKTITLYSDGFEFSVGAVYQVDFGSGPWVETTATSVGALNVAVPTSARPGPLALRVVGPGVDHSYPASLFTALAPAPMVPATDGHWVLRNFEASVASDGSLLLPFNLSNVQDATQFAMQLGRLPLAFENSDVVFYNSDAVDLTIFVLEVENPTERQWGSYHGWNVDRDDGLRGDVFKKKIRRALSLVFLSDMLTYWRHEFRTYNQAHLPGGSHEVDEHGFHKHLGTLHVDHDHLVLAISGRVRDPVHPDDPSKSTPLTPGAKLIDVYVATILSEHPVEPDQIQIRLRDAIDMNQVGDMYPETPSAYNDGDDD